MQQEYRSKAGMIAARTRACVVVFAILAHAGCRAEGPERFQVSGEVTFGGKPVPAGVIRFLPDTRKGNSGPAGYAAIDNGRYNTAGSGRGTVGGPHQVVIAGFDGQPAGPEEPQGSALFPEYRSTIDLPQRTTTAEFDLPAATAPP